MNQLTELLMYRALHFKQSSDNTTDSVLEHFVASNELALGQIQLKNVCAKLSRELADRLDSTCSVLDISKRRFIEAAIIYALDEADRIAKEVNMLEGIDQTEEGK